MYAVLLVQIITGSGEVREKFGVPPELFADFQALTGDGMFFLCFISMA